MQLEVIQAWRFHEWLVPPLLPHWHHRQWLLLRYSAPPPSSHLHIGSARVPMLHAHLCLLLITVKAALSDDGRFIAGGSGTHASVWEVRSRCLLVSVQRLRVDATHAAIAPCTPGGQGASALPEAPRASRYCDNCRLGAWLHHRACNVCRRRKRARMDMHATRQHR